MGEPQSNFSTFIGAGMYLDSAGRGLRDAAEFLKCGRFGRADKILGEVFEDLEMARKVLRNGQDDPTGQATEASLFLVWLSGFEYYLRRVSSESGPWSKYREARHLIEVAWSNIANAKKLIEDSLCDSDDSA